MIASLKRQLNLLAVGVILAVSLFISLAAVIAMDRLAHQLSASRMISELGWIRFEMGDTHKILKDTGVETLKSYLDSAKQETIQKFRDFRIGDTGRLYLVSDDGRIVSTPSDSQATDLDGPVLEMVIQEKVGHAELMIAGSPSIVYFDTFPEWGWRILLVISEKEINAERDNFILIAILILLLSACAGVFVFARVANGFVLPILELAEKLSGMKEDQLGQRLEVKHSNKEVGILLSAFSKLSDRLLAAKNTLQEQNEELQVRKKELQNQNDELISAQAMLRESEQRHRSILQTAMDGIFFLDTEGRFVEVNETYCRMSGYRMQELLAMYISDVEYLETASATATHIKKIIEQGEDRFESQHRRKDGSKYNVEVSVQYRSADGGQFVVFLQDITERKRAEEALRKSEERFLLAMKASNDGLFDWNLETNEIYYSPAWKKMLGYEDHELPNDFSIWENNTDPLDVKKAWEIQRKLLSKEIDKFVFEFKMKHKNGRWIDILSRAEAIFNDSGQAARIVGTHTDITERKRVEEQLRDSSMLLSRSQQIARLGSWKLDLPSKRLEWSDEVFRIFGLEPGELRATYEVFLDVVHPEDRTVVDEAFTRSLQDRRDSYEIEHRIIRKDNGEVRVVSERAIHERDDAGVVLRSIGMVQDITERKWADEEKKLLNAQLQQAQKLEAIGTLAGGIAHDFNNILGAIVGYSEMIRDDFPPKSPGIHDINQVLKASHRAKALVKQILAFSRQVEDQKIPLQPAVIVKEAITLLRSSLPTTITIKQDIDAEGGMILADPTQIHQIVMNLATNAFHAMEVKGGILTISLQKRILFQNDLTTAPDLQPGTFLQLSIKDTGEGILPEIREKIFDPFFTTKEVGKGTGLGLSMVYSIVKSCNGSIVCDSRVGEGTEFRILLPVLEGHAEEEAQSSTALTLQGKERILLIDDEAMLAELGQAMLIRLGYQVTTRRNSLDALATFQNQPDAFDLIITDQTMPGMTGVDLARRILQIRPQMPIILCTGYSSQISEDQAKAAGIKGFAYKPLAKKEIGELIRKVLDEKNP